MKKVATVTFHMAWNYGAILQTYALQKAIQDLGYETDVWNYDCKKISDCYSVVQTNGLKAFIKSLLIYNQKSRKDKNFRHFIKENINLTENITEANRADIAKCYDAFVVGSDQVWNYRITDGDPAYFLDFAPANKRLSYAASLGLHGYPEKWKDIYQKNLQSFKEISTREAAGAAVLKELLHRDVSIDVDPVFLLDKKKWKEISAPAKEKDYIFVYMPGKHCLDLAKNLAKKNNLKIIYIPYDISLRRPTNNIGEIRLYAGPDEFLTLLQNATYVVTGSFHATAFSLLFHKRFVVEPPETDGGRITGILNSFNLSECLYHGQDLHEWSSIDWQEVDRISESMRKESLHHLQSYIELAGID